jgi:hypothetical protein
MPDISTAAPIATPIVAPQAAAQPAHGAQNATTPEKPVATQTDQAVAATGKSAASDGNGGGASVAAERSRGRVLDIEV